MQNCLNVETDLFLVCAAQTSDMHPKLVSVIKHCAPVALSAGRKPLVPHQVRWVSSRPKPITLGHHAWTDWELLSALKLFARSYTKGSNSSK
jgi:hypothetical protein